MFSFINNRKSRPTANGSSMIEVVLAIFVVSVAFAAILQALPLFLKGGLRASEQVQAHFILEETIEAIRFMRDESYASNITPLIGAGTHYLEEKTNGWKATTTDVAVFGTYSRSFEITEVYRASSNDDIVPATSAVIKTVDPGTARVTVTIEWAGGEQLTANTYVTDLYDN